MLKGVYKLFPFGSIMEKVVTSIENKAIKTGMAYGYNVIIDSTGFRYDQKKFQYLIDHFNVKVEIVDFTHVSLEECIERDKNREITIGETVIRKMYNRYLKNGMDKTTSTE